MEMILGSVNIFDWLTLLNVQMEEKHIQVTYQQDLYIMIDNITFHAWVWEDRCLILKVSTV